MVGAIMGLAGGLIGSSVQGRNQKEAQLRQARINQQQATFTQGLAKEYWDYTNWENQVDHLKNAGLNPALMYNSGGAGGQSGGGKAEGVDQPRQEQMAVAQNAMAMGLQLENLKSQIKVNESVAEKNLAEAEKTSGVDTEAVKTGIENMIAQTQNEKVKNGLIKAQTRVQDAIEEMNRNKTEEIGWNIRNIEKGIDFMERNIEATELSNELKKRTMEAEVQKAAEALKNIMANTMVQISDNRVKQEQAEQIAESVKQAWSKIGVEMANKEINRQRVEQEGERIYNELQLGKEGNNIKDKSIIKDYVIGIGNMVLKGAQIMK